MDDDRVPGRPLFGREDPRHGGVIQSIGSQAIHGLGGQSHQPAIAQNRGRLVERILRFRRLYMVGVNGQPQCLHAFIVAFHAHPAPSAVYSLLTMPVETEIKFRVDDLEDLARRLEHSGFRLRTPRSFESNVLYDTADRRMRARTEILRIRSYAGRWILTHKRLPDSGPGEDTHKHRIETETEISDGEALAAVFRSLGLAPAFRYEKWRSEWDDGEGHCVVDETPIGNFAELEGSADWIDRAAGRLDIAPEHYITLSYGRLFDKWREQQGSSAQDLTFAAVSGAPVII
jgi:adenylate cyclase class 2